jgi:predicted nuclease of predicted toxin-antitoxin system
LRKSKKRSASSSTSKPPDPPLVFFVDECLGTAKVPAALRDAGAEVRTLADEFESGMKDVDWLTGLHGHDWIVLTKDKNIRRRPLEIDALIGAGLRVFVVTATDLTGEEAGQIIVKALPKIRRLCKRQPPPFIAGITRMSDVTLFENPKAR